MKSPPTSKFFMLESRKELFLAKTGDMAPPRFSSFSNSSNCLIYS